MEDSLGVRRVADRGGPWGRQGVEDGKEPRDTSKAGAASSELHNMIYLIHERVESSGQVCMVGGGKSRDFAIKLSFK